MYKWQGSTDQFEPWNVPMFVQSNVSKNDAVQLAEIMHCNICLSVANQKIKGEHIDQYPEVNI